jgi:hypothetical protein
MSYGLTLANEILIAEKANTKKNGCYLFRGVAYRVLDTRVTHYAADGKIMERAGHFNCVIGSYEYGSDYGRKALLTIK